MRSAAHITPAPAVAIRLIEKVIVLLLIAIMLRMC